MLFSENLLQIFSYSPFLRLSYDFNINPLPLHWSLMLFHFWSCKLYFADTNLFVWSWIQVCLCWFLVFGCSYRIKMHKTVNLLSHFLKIFLYVYCTKTTGWNLVFFFTFCKERPPGGHEYNFIRSSVKIFCRFFLIPHFYDCHMISTSTPYLYTNP